MKEAFNAQLDAQLFDYELECVYEKNILIDDAALGYKPVMRGGYKDWQYIVNKN